MTVATSRDQLLEWLDQARSNLMSAINGLTEEQMSRQEIDDWSVKDHLTHLTVWDEMRFFEISRITRGGEPAMPPTDEAGVRWINEGFADLRRQLPIAQVLSDLEFSHDMVKQAVSAAPEKRLSEDLYGEVGPVGAAHEALHAGTIRSWRRRMSI